MSVLQGAKYVIGVDTEAAQVAGDVSEYTIATISDASTSPCTVTTAGANEVAYGVFAEDVDYSEDGGRTTVIRNGQVPLTAADAITDATVPLKAAASGQATPCTADLDNIIGMPMHTAAAGAIVLVDLKLMGSIYGV